MFVDTHLVTDVQLVGVFSTYMSNDHKTFYIVHLIANGRTPYLGYLWKKGSVMYITFVRDEIENDFGMVKSWGEI